MGIPLGLVRLAQLLLRGRIAQRRRIVLDGETVSTSFPKRLDPNREALPVGLNARRFIVACFEVLDASIEFVERSTGQGVGPPVAPVPASRVTSPASDTL